MNQNSQLGGNPFMVMKIIAFALIQGVFVFGIVAIFLGMDKEPSDPFLTYIAAGFGGLMIVMRFVVPPMIANSQVGQLRGTANESSDIDEQNEKQRMHLLAIYQTTMIIGFALLEGAAFFNLVAYIVEVSPISLVVTGVLLAVMSMGFPFRGRVETWVEDQQRMLM